MFKPKRFVFLEGAPASSRVERSSKKMNSNEFMKEVDKFEYNLEDSKKEVYKILTKPNRGWKLTKAEALYRSGKLTTVQEMDNASSRKLEADDVTAFLAQYGGDKYVKRLFHYGTSFMKRTVLRRKRGFERDKQRGGAWEGLKKYETFEEAFQAGFYKDLTVNFEEIIEKGLSVSEYRQRTSRFDKLRSRLKRLERKTGKDELEAKRKKAERIRREADKIREEAEKRLKEQEEKTVKKESKETKVKTRVKEETKKAPEKIQFERSSVQAARELLPKFYVTVMGEVKYPKQSSGETIAKLVIGGRNDKDYGFWYGELELTSKGLIDHFGGQKKINSSAENVRKMQEFFGIKQKKSVEKNEILKRKKIEKAYSKLKEVGEEMRKSDLLIKKTKEKYSTDPNGKEVFKYIDPVFENAENKDAYIKEFLGKVVVTTDVGNLGKDFGNFVKTPGDMTADSMNELIKGYTRLAEREQLKLEDMERALYMIGGSGIDPRGLHESVRKESVAEAEKAIPEIATTQSQNAKLKGTTAKWKMLSRDVLKEK